MKSTTSLLLRNLFFTILQPGLVAGLIPFLLTRDELNQVLRQPFQFVQYAGLVVFAFGLVIMLNCIIRFALEGRGTLSPVDPTKRLVVTGLYRYSRNPMYVGVMMLLLGEALFAQSLSLWIYSLTIFIAFNLFIRFREEPRLKRDFGDEYVQYCRKVGRWI